MAKSPLHRQPEVVTIYKRGANTAELVVLNEGGGKQ